MKRVLKNYAGSQSTVPVALTYREGTPEWNDAYANYIVGKNPTDHPAWKNGVFLTLERESVKELLKPKKKMDDEAVFFICLITLFFVLGAVAFFVR